ncbi:hypothetical protein BGZ81_000494 [Podila clonocystis]|nr:hypothetical protein BGZ81_000494 [Podila clonocystis]
MRNLTILLVFALLVTLAMLNVNSVSGAPSFHKRADDGNDDDSNPGGEPGDIPIPDDNPDMPPPEPEIPMPTDTPMPPPDMPGDGPY